MVASKSPNPAKRSSMEKNNKSTPTSSGKKGHGSSAVGDSPSGNQRPPNTNDPILLSIASRQATLVQQQITLTCYIPSNSVGAVIGRKGATIAHIQKQAQQAGTSNGPVRLSVVGHQTDPSLLSASSGGGGDPATASSTTDDTHSSSPPGGQPQLPQSPKPHTQTISTTPLTPSVAASSSVPYTYSELDWSSPNWTPVVIRADPCSALTAAQLLRERVEYMDDVVMDVPLGRAKHAAIVGRRGFILANLSADTSVRIMVPRRELRHDVIQLEGDLDNVKQCLDRILGITSDSTTAKKGKGSAASTSNNNSNSNNANNETRQQPQDSKGNNTNNNNDSSSSGTTQIVLNVLTLPSQTKLRTVGRKTDTIIKKKKAGGAWDVTISGSSQDNVQSAVAMLKKWMDDKSASNNNDNSNNDDAGGDTSNSNNNNNNNNSNSNNSGTPARPKGRGRLQGRGNNKNKGNRGKGNNNNSNNNNKSSEASSLT